MRQVNVLNDYLLFFTKVSNDYWKEVITCNRSGIKI